MNNTPNWIKKHWDLHPAKCCERAAEGTCKGRLTKEHVFIYAGKQIQELWAIIDLCEFHHAVNGYMDCGDLRKRVNEVISAAKATEDDLKKYPKRDWELLRKYEYDPKSDGLIRLRKKL